MSIQERIKKGLTQAIKDKNEEMKNNLRVIMGEFSRGDKKQLSDDECIIIMKKIAKNQYEMLELLKKDERSERIKTLQNITNFLELLHSYLPKMAGNDDVRKWIEDNIDFSKYKNKMQAMRDVMAHFGTTVDGNNVKDILQKI
jgi:uncharacterized protein